MTTEAKSSRTALLEGKAEDLRRRLAWDPVQLGEIHELYARYVDLGRPFPADLEEHSLRLILKFIRPDDDSVARRLATVLQMQGKPVPKDLHARAARGILSSPEQMAAERRHETVQRGATANMPATPLHERLIFVMGLPKSASRLMVSVLAAMHPDERYRKAAVLPYTTGYVGYDATSDLRYESLAQFNNGGVVHTHAGATCVTRHALARLGLGHIITVRHPADHVAALYCHLRRIARMLPASLIEEIRYPFETARLPDPSAAADTYGRGDESSHLYFHPVIFPVDPRYFLASVEVDDAIAHMIGGGYLFHALSWIVSWQLLRVRNTSVIVRYEDFVGDPENTLRRVNSVIYGGDPEHALARGRQAMAEKAYGTSFDPGIYPRGPTGDRDIWKNYLSASNRCLYNSVCERFVTAHPYGSLLNGLYGDLLVDTRT